MGSAPAVLGASRYGLLTIGITNDESVANAVMVRGDAAGTWLKRPARDLRGRTVMVTRSSTGEYVLLAYLKSLKLDVKDVKVQYMDQPEIVKAFAGKTGDVFVLWAPYLYDALARGGKVLANGRTAGVTVPGALVAVPGFARERPEAVARFLRVYVKGLEWQRGNPAAALDILAKFNRRRVSSSTSAGSRSPSRRGRSGALPASSGFWGGRRPAQRRRRVVLGGGAYFTAAGALQANPDPKTYLTDEYMKLAAAARQVAAAGSEEVVDRLAHRAQARLGRPQGSLEQRLGLADQEPGLERTRGLLVERCRVHGGDARAVELEHLAGDAANA